MSAISRILERFRRLGSPPGAPAAGLGVPARPGEAGGRELESVFAEIDAIEREAEAIRAQGQADAERLLDEGRRAADGLRDDGEQAAVRVRASVGEARARLSQQELARIEAEADAEVDRIARTSAGQQARLADAALVRGLGS